MTSLCNRSQMECYKTCTKRLSGQRFFRLNNFELWVARSYVLLLPFRMFSQFLFLKSVFGVTAIYVDFILSVLGVLLWIVNCNGKMIIHDIKVWGIFKFFFYMIVWFNLSSFFMAFVMQSVYGNQGGESAFQGVSGMIVYYTQYALILLYNTRVFSILTKKQINIILDYLCYLLLMIGYLQLLSMIGVSFSSMIYYRINVFNNLNVFLPKLSLTVSEGSTAGLLIGILVYPYLLSRILSGDNILKYTVLVLLWLPLIYFTFSSTAYILAVTSLSIFVGILLLQQKNVWSFIKSLFSVIVGILVALIIISLFDFSNAGNSSNSLYLLVHKVFDYNNGSTVSRTIPLLVNWGAFKEYPFFGVGNGLQGYFYEKYFPGWALYVPGSDANVFLAISKTGISNGALFIPSILSGYGIIGATIFLVFLSKCYKLVLSRKRILANFYYMYILGIISFIIAGFQSDFYGTYFVWFVVSIPLMVTNTKKISS